MSIVNIFTKRQPSIGPPDGSYEFDAVLEDTLDISVDVTSYPVESGVRIANHRIYQPIKYYLTGAVSNNPLKVQVTDFIGGALSNLTDNPWLSGAAGLSVGWLSGGDETRAGTALQFLIDLMTQGGPFDIDAGDITLTNMVITRLSRTKDPSNENALIFVAELQEYIELSRLLVAGDPAPDQLPEDDPAKSALSKTIDKGQQIAKDVNEAVSGAVNTVLDGIF